MNLNHSVKKALAAIAFGIGAFCASAAPASAATDLVFCNKTGAKIFIATVYQDAQTGRWMLSAWHTRNPGSCESFGGRQMMHMHECCAHLLRARCSESPASLHVEKGSRVGLVAQL